jgi:hypothetical protein
MPTIEVVDVRYYRQEKLKPLVFSIHSRSFTRLDRDADKRELTLQEMRFLERSNRRFRSVVQSDEVRTLRLSLSGPRERRRLLQTFPGQSKPSKLVQNIDPCWVTAYVHLLNYWFPVCSMQPVNAYLHVT